MTTHHFHDFFDTMFKNQELQIQEFKKEMKNTRSSCEFSNSTPQLGASTSWHSP
jgi:hypothetical protein